MPTFEKKLPLFFVQPFRYANMTGTPTIRKKEMTTKVKSVHWKRSILKKSENRKPNGYPKANFHFFFDSSVRDPIGSLF